MHPLRNMPGHGHVLVAGLVALVSVACSAATSRQSLPEALQSFNDGVRWANPTIILSALAAECDPEYRKNILVRMDGIEFMDVEVIAVTPEPTGDLVVALVRMSWTETGSTTVQTGYERQYWAPRDGRWVLVRQVLPEDPKVKGTPFVRVRP